MAVPRPSDNSPEVPLPVPPPPLEGPEDGDAIRSGGQLARFAPRWFDTPSLPATTVRRGFHWMWASDPPALRFPSTTQRQLDLREPTLDWVTKVVVVPVLNQPCFLSRLFAVLRPDNHSTLAKLLSPLAFMASLGIAEPYTHVLMCPNIRRYLAFSYMGQLYFFHALPFGLNAAPFIFTQVLAWPLQCLRARGISLLAYMDDIVVWHRDKDTLLAQMQQVMCFLQEMGFRLNLAKSHPYPAETAVWLGVQWLPQSGHWHLPLDGQSRIRQIALDLLASPRVTLRQLERMVGLLNFACQVHQFLRPYVQPLTRSNTLVRATERERPVLLPPYMQDVLRFWASPVPWRHVPSFHVFLPQLSLWTDASPQGWGALLEPARVASGRWSSSEAPLHVNLLELRVVVFFNLRDLSLRIFTDNETVRYALASCRARSPSLRQELLAFLSEVVSQNLWFQVLRVPTALNVVADALSREEPLNTEWTLPRAAFADVLRWSGPLEVDLMASPVNHRLPRWVSPFPHPDALAVDCRSIDWNAFRSFYLFPHPAMLPQLLHLILSCMSQRVVVVPWRPHHLHLLVTPYQQTGVGIVLHSSGPSAHWTALLFCARS